MRFFKVALAVSCVALSAGAVCAQQRQVRPPQDFSPRFQPVLDWLERAHRDYQEIVVKELSTPTGKAAPADPSRTDTVPSASPSLLNQVMVWLGLEAAKPNARGQQAPPLAGDLKSAKSQSEIDARIKRQIEARAEEKRRADEEQRLADAARTLQGAVDAATRARQQAAAEARVAAVETQRKEQPPPARELALPQPTVVFVAPAKPAVAAAPAAPVVPPPAAQTAQTSPVGPALPAAPVKAPSSAASVASSDEPVRWNRIPRGAANAAASLAEAAGKLRVAAGKAIDKVAGTQPSAGSAGKVLVVAHERNERHERKVRSCRQAGRSVDPPATYTVKKGDSLWTIARRHYERGRRYLTIVRANDGKFADPDLIFPCQKVYLPKRHAWVEVASEPS